MALVKSTLQMEIATAFAKPNPDPMKPGKDIAKAYKNYLLLGMNSGGFPASNVVDQPTGLGIGGVFASQLLIGTAIGSSIAGHLSTMALTFMSGMQIGPPAAPPSHMGPLQELYSSLPPTSLEHAKELSNILDKWTKGWTVSGIYPPPSAAPFSGPLS